MIRNREQKKIWLNWQGGLSGYSCQLTASRLLEVIPDDYFGVYVIWEFTVPGHEIVIKVGQGNIKERLSAHRNDEKIIGDNSEMRIILVSWAEVEPKHVDGVEKYLGRVLEPVLGERFPNAEEIEVNKPF